MFREDDCDATRFAACENRISSILNELEDLPAPVPTGEDVRLNADMFADEIGLSLVSLQRLLALLQDMPGQVIMCAGPAVRFSRHKTLNVSFYGPHPSRLRHPAPIRPLRKS